MSAEPSPGQRQFKRLSPLTPVVRSFVVVVAAVSAMWRDFGRGDLGLIGWGLLGLLVAGAGYGTASWLCTKYWVEDDELRVDTGVVNRQSRRIRIDRLQGVDIVQPLIARLFGLAELRMDVAGGGRAEGSLAFLSLREANELRAVLLRRRDQVRGADDGADGGAVDGAGADSIEGGPPPRELAKVDPGMLVVSMLLTGETFGFLLSGAAFLVVVAVGGSVAAGSSILPAVLGFALFQARRLGAFYRFTVSAIPAGIQIRRGLFELSTQTIAVHRVQGVVLVEPLLWRRFGWARLDVSVAGYESSGDDGNKPSQSTVLPVARRPAAVQLARYLLRGLDPESVEMTPPPRRARWITPVWRRFMAAGTGDSVVASRGGLLSRRTHVVPHARVQSLRLHQGPWQRRLGLAEVLVDSPAGAVRVRARHRDEHEARAMLEREGELAGAARVTRGV